MNQDVVFVAEFTTNHMGNLNVLLRMVDKAADAGASFIKMQKKDVESFYSGEKLAMEYRSPYGQTYRDYRTIFEFEDEDYERFDRRCKERGISWFTTVQDLPSLEWMLRYDLPMYKVASSNSRNADFLKQIAQSVPKDKVVVISVAGATLGEIENTLNVFPDHRVYVLHCVAEYPCKYHNLRLGNISVLKEHFEDQRVSIGYSGHEEGLMPSLAAYDFDSKMIERHFCLSRYSFVHHIECSLEPHEFKQMVKLCRHSVKGLADWYQKYLPPLAFSSGFGMSDMEESFLLKQTYGHEYLNGKRRAHF